MCATYQSDFIAGPFEGVHRRGVRHVHYCHIINLQNGVVNAQPSISRRRPAGDEFRDINSSVIANVRVVRATGDAEPQTCTASFQYNLFVLPFCVTIHLRKRNRKQTDRLSEHKEYLYPRQKVKRRGKPVPKVCRDLISALGTAKL